ncbi:hypothetical protein DFH09DRAFT_945771 [Mycena vulgaris]|nr:hypothetical protein DFH09DRAFT_945771 [Mycena vulgaris]
MTSPGRKKDLKALSKGEIYWRDHQVWLQECGYMLRPCFRPGWIPSWITDPTKDRVLSEDSIVLDVSERTHSSVTSVSQLSLPIQPDLHPDEANIFKYFSSKELASDPRNHCIPLLQPLCIPLLSVLSPPDDDEKLILVMKLMWQHDRPRFDTFGEVMEFSRQAFEGIQFTHHHPSLIPAPNSDCNGYNIMMDGQHLFPHGFHPQYQDMKRDKFETPTHYTRTQRPVKYYIIDFGLSRKFQEGEVPRTYIIEGGDSSPPEFGTIQERLDSAIPHKLLDSFPTDIYYLGNMIRRNYFDTAKFGFEFMRPLVSDMVQDDPAKRPTIDEVVARFDEIRAGLSSWKLRSDSPPTLAFLKVKSNRLTAVSQLSYHRKLHNFTIYIAGEKHFYICQIHITA